MDERVIGFAAGPNRSMPSHTSGSSEDPGGEGAMATTILGISAFYHDSAACLLRDGDIVAAAQEERFTRKRHDADFPHHAVAYCLKEAGIRAGELDYIGFYDKPFLKFERVLENYLGVAPRGWRSFIT